MKTRRLYPRPTGGWEESPGRFVVLRRAALGIGFGISSLLLLAFWVTQNL